MTGRNKSALKRAKIDQKAPKTPPRQEANHLMVSHITLLSLLARACAVKLRNCESSEPETGKQMSETPNPPTQPEDSKGEPKPKRLRGPALKRLRKATAQTVRENSAQIAKSLLDHTLEGDMSCAKVLLALLEEKPGETQKRSRHNLDFIERLEREPQWIDPNPRPPGEPWHNAKLKPVTPAVPSEYP